MCEDHYQRIQSGEDYEWDFDQHVIYMGDDVKATGEYLYEDMTVTEDVGHNDLKFRLELRRRGSDERTWIDVRMSHAQAREVAQVFQMFARED